jgi:hypothetical protein
MTAVEGSRPETGKPHAAALMSSRPGETAEISSLDIVVAKVAVRTERDRFKE